MKKLVLLLSFVFVLGIAAVNANDNTTMIKKEPVKTEKKVIKPVGKKIETASTTTTKKKPVVKKKRVKKVAPKTEIKKEAPKTMSK
jgi:hypothetical protein